MSEPAASADSPNRFRRQQPSLLKWLGISVILIALALGAMIGLAHLPSSDPAIPPPPINPDDAVVTVVAADEMTEQVLAKALSAYDGGHHLFLFFGTNRLPPGRYQLRAQNAPGSVEFQPSSLSLKKRDTVTVRVRLVKN